ncbi:MAG: hypothetical protein CMB66_03435, partial [Euryarchaeota archaeon]|nr:hypothetical protein [Euryarchaeota archaeon]
WEVDPAMPPGLEFDNNTGVISGTPTTSFGPTDFTVWANNSQHSSSFSIRMSASLLDTDGDGMPDETDPDDDNDGWLDVNETACLTDGLDPISFPTDSDLDGECDGVDDIDDSPIFLVYNTISQLLFVNEPIDPIIATTYGGDVRTWEIWPPLPAGLTLNGMGRFDAEDGTISGAPMGEFDLGIFTVWANNSQYQSSVEITLQSVVPDPDDNDFDLIYLEDSLNLTTFFDGVYLEPQIFGGNISSWSISPQLPDGLEFNQTNGVLNGTPQEELNQTTFTITGSNALFLNTFEIRIEAHYLDTDGDGIPDLFDPDDDGDGWNDTVEIDCGTDPLDVLSVPDDYDGDAICDPLDEFDDSPLVFFYPIDKLVLTVGEEMEPLEPTIAPTSGEIMEFSVVPDLPDGLILNTTTGVISGTPEEAFRHILIEYSHTFSAINSQWKFSYRVDFDIFPPIDNNTDDDGDGWSDEIELECLTDPNDNSSFPEDIDLDGVCNHIDEDDDGDNIGDSIDMFPKNPTAWDDTDNDTWPDELTCIYLTDSANCTFTLIEDPDDDNDGWLDVNETSCGTDPKDNLSVPKDDDGDGVCNLLEEYVPDAVKILWICCFPLLLLLLVLLWLLNPFSVDEEEILGPEPEFTYTDGDWEGTGEYDDPYKLRTVRGVRKGSFAHSHELITVTNITPRTTCEFTDMSSEQNGTRFKMSPIKSNTKGEIEFRLEFRDDSETPLTTEFTGLIRLGKSTVYFQWDVEVEVIKDTPEEELAKRRASQIEREARKRAREIEKKSSDMAAENEIREKKEAAQRVHDLRSRVEKIEKDAEERAAAAELKAIEAEKRAFEMEKEAARRAKELEEKKRAEESERIEREEAEERAAAEEKARKEAEEAEERERKAEEEAAELRAMLRKKAEERKAEEEAEKARKEAEEKEAEEEAKRADEEAERLSARLLEEAKERAAEEERQASRKAAEEERQAQMKAMEAKEKLRKRAIERKKEEEEESRESEESRKKAEERLAEMEKELEERRGHLEEMGEDERKKELALLRISEKSKDIDFGIIGFATKEERNDLQKISGIGPFIEEKLNALGIFTFRQISRMSEELEEKINDAIEFFPGRIHRDEWALKAKDLIEEVDEDTSDLTEEAPSDFDLISEAKEEMAHEEEEAERQREVSRRMKMAEELLKSKERDSGTEEDDSDESVVDFGKIGFGTEEEKDDLKQIDGIGRFVEEKLNSIGIYNFSQIANMDQKITEQVNEAIGLGPGRIERDEWVLQAKRMKR